MSRLLVEMSKNKNSIFINTTLKNISRVHINEYYDIFHNTGNAIHKNNWNNRRNRKSSTDLYLDRYSTYDLNSLLRLKDTSKIYNCLFPDIDDYDLIESQYLYFDFIYGLYIQWEGYLQKRFRIIIE